VYASCMEAYGLSLDEVVGKFNFGQITMLAEIAQAKADDMDRNAGERPRSRGRKLNKSNKEAAEMLRAGL
jgi:hypothetical protein